MREITKKENKFKTPIIMLLATVIYTILVTTVDRKAIGPAGTSVGFATINGLVHDTFGVHMWMYKFTNLIGYLAILAGAVFAVIGLLQLIKRKSLLKVDKEILALGVLYIVMAILYVLFDKVALNYRPILMEGETTPEASFPSSHTMLITVILMSIAMIEKKYVKNINARKVIVIACMTITAVAVILRLLSGVHWFTDIIGGLLISVTLLSFFGKVVNE